MSTKNPVTVSFDNTENAFEYKSNKELKKARFLFKTMSFSSIVKWGTRLTPWAIEVGLPINKLIRSTIFTQFVGGETLEETAPVAHKLGEYHVQVILDYGVEGGDDGEAAYDNSCNEFIKVINYASTQPNIPFMSVKVTGIARLGLLEKMDDLIGSFDPKLSLMKRYVKALDALSTAERSEWYLVNGRLQRICEAGSKKNVGVLIDAEETWIQDPVDVMTTLMMEQFNIDKVTVYNTFQLYRHDRLKFLKDSYEAADQRRFLLGAKLVRGAYMEKERERAVVKGYESPIQPDKQSTDRDYNEAVRFCIEHVDTIAVIVASHNEESNMYATRLLDEQGLEHNHPRVHFSQLYGMSDNITFNLAKAGFSVSKYLPFGPIKDVIPYLMRRAQENSSVKGQTGRELGLIKKEMERRGV